MNHEEESSQREPNVPDPAQPACSQTETKLMIIQLNNGKCDFQFSSKDPLINKKINNFVIISLLGEGSFGKVYRAHDLKLDRDVAIKFLRESSIASRKILFDREAKAIAVLSKHPNIVTIYEKGDYQGQNYIVLEYVESNVSRLLEEHPDGLPLTVALRIAAECAEALQEAHRNKILHRDIKPSNILLELSTGLAKLTDFGLARMGVESGDFTLDRNICGSPCYMSPEQANAESLDERSDIFSLGVTLYQMLSGKRPFTGTTQEEILYHLRRNEYPPLSQLLPDLPWQICRLVEKAMAFHREDRFQSAGDLARALRAALRSLERYGKISDSSELLELKTVSSNKSILSGRRMVHLAGATTLFAAMLIAAVTLLFSSQQTEARNSQAMQTALFAMARQDYESALASFKAEMELNPQNDNARYGYSLALARLGRIEDCTKAIESIKNPEFYNDAKTALAYFTNPAELRSQRVDERPPTGYSQVLLAKLEIEDGNFSQAEHYLKDITKQQFTFPWQYAEALETLGKAQYHAGKLEEAKASFEHLAKQNVGPTGAVAQAYLSEISSQLDDTHRQEVQSRIASIKKLIDEGTGILETHDEWTSRPLTFAVLPGNIKRSRIALESGLHDLLPSLLGSKITEKAPVVMVDRELVRDILAEQELSGMLSSNEGRLRLGRVLGARLLIKCDFSRADTKEKILVTVDDTETTERISVPVIDIDYPVVLDQIADKLASVIWEKVSDRYPLQARLYAGANGPEINIGLAAGVKAGMSFDIFTEADAPPIPNASAKVVETLGKAASRVIVEGIDSSNLGSTPDAGWFVRIHKNDMV